MELKEFGNFVEKHRINNFGDMELEGKMLNEVVIVDDEKLSKAYDHAKELQKAREEAYERGRKSGYEAGLAQAINILEKELEED